MNSADGDLATGPSPLQVVDLPVELWQTVLTYLPRDCLRNLLLMSQFFRSLVLPKLFSTLDIHFGSYFMEQSSIFMEEVEENRRLVNRAYDLLTHIQREPAFAKHVSHLRVHAFASGTAFFELRHLGETLKKLPRLRSITWAGSEPNLESDVAAVLSESCKGLEHISLENIDNGAACALKSLTNVHAFRLMSENKRRLFPPYISADAYELSSLLEKFGGRLRELALPGSVAWNVPLLRSSSGLTHLDITEAGACPGLDLFIRHAAELQSLTLLGLNNLEFLELLPFSDKILSQLIVLKLSIKSTSTRLSRDGESLAEFLVRHAVRLERFDFSLDIMMHANDFEIEDEVDYDDKIFFAIVAAIKQLHSLKALGISFCPIDSSRKLDILLNDLCEMLSKSIIALRVSAFPQFADDPIYYDGMLETFRTFTSLRFLSLAIETPIGSDGQYIDHYPVEDVVADLSHIDHVCLDHRMWDVELLEGVRTTTSRWPEEKIRYRTRADFTTDEAYWLMAYYLPWEPAWTGLEGVEPF